MTGRQADVEAAVVFQRRQSFAQGAAPAVLAGNEGPDRQAFPLEPRRLGGKKGFAQSRMRPGIEIVQAVDAGKVRAGFAQGV